MRIVLSAVLVRLSLDQQPRCVPAESMNGIVSSEVW
jgi:hypothetical protein